MKYKVMECHRSYAILMDEESRFVHAANLNYEVGQTVEDPFILNEDPKNFILRSVIVRSAAIAAGLILMSASVFGYYVKNLKTDSVMTIGDDVKIEMELNSYGKVIRLHSNSDEGQEILKNYNGKNKKSSVAANELLRLEIEQGLISDGDTVDLYISSDDPEAYNNVKKDLETGLSDLKVNVNVKDPSVPAIKDTPKPVDPPKPADPVKPDDGNPPTPPVPPVQPATDENGKHVVPKPADRNDLENDRNKDKNKDKNDNKPAAPVDPPVPPEVDPPVDPAGNDKPVPPVPTAPAVEDNGEKPAERHEKPIDTPAVHPTHPVIEHPHDDGNTSDGVVTPPVVRPRGVEIRDPAPATDESAPAVHEKEERANAEEHEHPVLP